MYLKSQGGKGSGTSKVHTYLATCDEMSLYTIPQHCILYHLKYILYHASSMHMYTLVQYTIILGCVLNHEHEVQLNSKRLYRNIYLAVAPCDARGVELKGGADAEPDALVD